MIARIAQRSFSKIENYLENTISKMCASTANQTDWSRAGPPKPSPPPQAPLPGQAPPARPCALHVSSVCSVIPSLASHCSLLRGSSVEEKVS